MVFVWWWVFGSQSIFERFDKDRSGRIDTNELRDALLSLGFSVSPMVLDLLVSKFDKSGGRNKAIEYDNFIEYVHSIQFTNFLFFYLCKKSESFILSLFFLLMQVLFDCKGILFSLLVSHS